MSEINKIVEELINNRDIERILSGYSFSPVFSIDIELKKDFVQEIIIIILEYKNKKELINRYKEGTLLQFIVVVVRNCVTKYGLYDKKYGRYQKNRISFEDWHSGNGDW